MAVVTTTLNLAARITSNWTIPPGGVVDTTAIPRGLATAIGSATIAAKLAANQSQIRYNITLPENYVYMPRNLTFYIESTTQALDVGNIGYGVYNQSDPTTNTSFELLSDGITYSGSSLTARKMYRAMTLPRARLETGDTITGDFHDVSTDASDEYAIVAYGDFLVYDIEQCAQWPLNSPLPVYPQ